MTRAVARSVNASHPHTRPRHVLTGISNAGRGNAQCAAAGRWRRPPAGRSRGSGPPQRAGPPRAPARHTTQADARGLNHLWDSVTCGHKALPPLKAMHVVAEPSPLAARRGSRRSAPRGCGWRLRAARGRAGAAAAGDARRPAGLLTAVVGCCLLEVALGLQLPTRQTISHRPTARAAALGGPRCGALCTPAALARWQLQWCLWLPGAAMVGWRRSLPSARAPRRRAHHSWGRPRRTRTAARAGAVATASSLKEFLPCEPTSSPSDKAPCAVAAIYLLRELRSLAVRHICTRSKHAARSWDGRQVANGRSAATAASGAAARGRASRASARLRQGDAGERWLWQWEPCWERLAMHVWPGRRTSGEGRAGPASFGTCADPCHLLDAGACQCHRGDGTPCQQDC